MIKDIKRLKKLLKLQYENESQMRLEGFTLEALKNDIEKQQNKIEKNFNALGWILMFLIFIPLALMQLGLKNEIAFLISYFSGGILVLVILPKITGRVY